MKKLDGKSMDVIEHNIEQLEELFPEVFAEGKISFDKLQELLGNYVNVQISICVNWKNNYG